MRAFIISTLSLSFVILVWSFFYQYSNHALHHMVSDCENQVIPAVMQENWDIAYQSFDAQYLKWLAYSKKARYILETDKLDGINEGYAKTLMYIKAKDLSNSSGELLALQEELKALQKNESFIFSNIF